MKRAALPEPKPGLVIRYAYLWRREADKGQEERTKDRPCAVVLAVRKGDDRTRVVLAPITHAVPANARSAIEIPAPTKARLGLDGQRSWIVTDEVNVFDWPGPDLRIVDSNDPSRRFAYGFLPGKLVTTLIESVRTHLRDGNAKPVARD